MASIRSLPPELLNKILSTTKNGTAKKQGFYGKRPNYVLSNRNVLRFRLAIGKQGNNLVSNDVKQFVQTILKEKILRKALITFVDYESFADISQDKYAYDKVIKQSIIKALKKIQEDNNKRRNITAHRNSLKTTLPWERIVFIAVSILQLYYNAKDLNEAYKLLINKVTDVSLPFGLVLSPTTNLSSNGRKILALAGLASKIPYAMGSVLSPLQVYESLKYTILSLSEELYLMQPEEKFKIIQNELKKEYINTARNLAATHAIGNIARGYTMGKIESINQFENMFSPEDLESKKKLLKYTPNNTRLNLMFKKKANQNIGYYKNNENLNNNDSNIINLPFETTQAILKSNKKSAKAKVLPEAEDAYVYMPLPNSSRTKKDRQQAVK